MQFWVKLARIKPQGLSCRRTHFAHASDRGGRMLAAGLCPRIPPARGRRPARTQAKDERGASLSPDDTRRCRGSPGTGRAPPRAATPAGPGLPHPRGGSPRPRPAVLTRSPPHRPFPAAAEAHFAEDPQDMPLAEGAPVLAGAGAALGGGHPVAVGLPRLPLLPDQRAGDSRCHRRSWAPPPAPLRSGGAARARWGRAAAAPRGDGGGGHPA